MCVLQDSELQGGTYDIAANFVMQLGTEVDLWVFSSSGADDCAGLSFIKF